MTTNFISKKFSSIGWMKNAKYLHDGCQVFCSTKIEIHKMMSHSNEPMHVRIIELKSMTDEGC